jgi:hypothetical protein
MIEANPFHEFSIAHLVGPVTYEDVLASVRAQVREQIGDNDCVAADVAGMMWEHKCIKVLRSTRPMSAERLAELTTGE